MRLDFEARCLRFKGEDQKSGRDEEAYGGAIGWRLVQRLVKQARTRGQDHLITWPGPQHTWNVRMGRGVPRDAWRPLKSVRKSWATSAKDAGIEKPRRFHDVRGAYITQVARGTRSSRMIREAARHRDQSTTDRYIEIAQNETAKAVEKAMRPAGPKLRLVSGGRR
jgi:integrase